MDSAVGIFGVDAVSVLKMDKEDQLEASCGIEAPNKLVKRSDLN
jgi:hypothetical protein